MLLATTSMGCSPTAPIAPSPTMPQPIRAIISGSISSSTTAATYRLSLATSRGRLLTPPARPRRHCRRAPRSATPEEATTLVSGTVSISSGLFTGDMLAASTSGTSITASYSASTGVLSLTGSDTLAHYQQVLDSVSYSSSNQNPTNSSADPSRTISWVVNDGTTSSATQTTTINITGGPATNSLFSPSATPGTVTENDPSAVDLGVKFQASTQWHDHRHPLLQGAAKHRHPYRRSVDHLGHPARQRHLHQRDRERLAAGQFFEPGKHYGEHHLYRLVPNQCRRVFGGQQLLRQRANQRTVDRAVELIERR